MKTLKIIALVGLIQLACIVLTAFFILLLRHELRKAHPLPHPPLAPTSSWKRFSSGEGHFSAIFPGVPESTNILSNYGPTNVLSHLFYVNPNIQNSFVVGYSDSPIFERAAKSPDPREFLKMSQFFMASNLQGRVVYQQESEVEGFPAREFECVAGGKANYSTRVKYILAGQRVYQIYAIFLTACPYPQERAVFFNSFKIQNNTNGSP